MVEEFIAERLQLPLGFPHRLDSPAVQIREIRVLKVTALAKADYPPVQITVQIKATLAHRAVKLHGAWDFGAIDADVELTAHGIVAADGSHSIEPQAAALKAWWRDMTMVESKQIGRLGGRSVRLYLMQHGQAMREEHDPARPLTEKGRTDTKRVIEHAVESVGVRVTRIVHSGKLRARQTAEICAEHLPDATITEADGLDPKDSPELWRERAAREAEDVLVVGHLPHLARLAALLLCGNAAKEAIMFENAGIVCLERADRDDWSVRWILTPEVVGCP